jgi:TRAP-type C4-dicarboxylate transport system substrate-binding protein
MIKRAKKICFLVTIIMIMALLVCGCGGGNESASTQNEDSQGAEKEFKWDCFVVRPTNQISNAVVLQWAENIKERTNGKLEITIKSAGELPYKGTEIIRTISQGIVPVGEANTANIAGESPVGALPTYPFLISGFSDWEKAFKEVINPIFEKEMSSKGIKVLFFFADPPQYMFGKGEPLKELTDMKGRKMRGQNAYMQEFATQLGASSISITSGEIPQAINRGVIDMFVTSSVTTYQGKYHEFIDWVYKVPFSSNGAWMVVNEDAFNELPEEYQQIVIEESIEAEKIHWERKALEDDEANLAGIASAGVQIFEPTEKFINDGRELMKEYWDKWAKEAGPTAEEGLEGIKKLFGY